MLQDVKIGLRLLGAFSIQEKDSNRTIPISSRKGCALLAYLAMQQSHGATREQVATLLWGDRTDRQARHNLRQCLVSLRHELGEQAARLLTVEADLVRLQV